MIDKIKLAFLDVRNDLAPDVIIADPHLNKLFITACRARRLSDSIPSLNLALLNARKAGYFKGLPRSKRTTKRNQDEYKFASEMAVRFLERRDQITLHAILCDPERAKEFDELAARLAPGFSSFEYRWAALGLRKRKKLKPEILARVAKPESVSHSSVRELVFDDISARAGLYVFYTSNSALYVGETENLRKRIGKHLDHSDNKGLAQWLWGHGTDDLHLEFQVLSTGTSSRIRKALELELIISRRPHFNVSGMEKRS